jgi:hypothetical protein
MPTVPSEIASLARGYTETCIKILGGIAETCPDTKHRLTAVEMLLDRGWGKPSETTEVTGKGSIEIVVRHIDEGIKAPQK